MPPASVAEREDAMKKGMGHQLPAIPAGRLSRARGAALQDSHVFHPPSQQQTIPMTHPRRAAWFPAAPATI